MWWAHVLIAAALGPPIWHEALVMLDSCPWLPGFTDGWPWLVPHQVGSWRALQHRQRVRPRNADGSIDILLRSAAPTTLQSNWLPTPAGKPFNLTLRPCFPDESVLNGTYTPPTVSPTAVTQLTVK
jgi:hypothetical protein